MRASYPVMPSGGGPEGIEDIRLAAMTGKLKTAPDWGGFLRDRLRQAPVPNLYWCRHVSNLCGGFDYRAAGKLHEQNAAAWKSAALARYCFFV
ncbi:hypothetical protein ACFO8O_08980 [Hephaestia sp. GCM10023244]|uniref:hypothetical protein n=1 Tax=unclassified Hephaestia TaxID=2631281 RepID=UPI0020773293|nr:hypothetical protein [Hephaestia sp. MAHUQ-44]MCM8731091.1 hypothetical protein [Hephaestia sp. MAHUQ-44]